MTYFNALLDVEIDDNTYFREIAEVWLLGAVRDLAPSLWEKVERANLPMTSDRYDAAKAVLGEPHGVWAGGTVVRRPWGAGAYSQPYREGTLHWLSEELAARPLEAHFKLVELDGDGVAINDGGRAIRVSIRSAEDRPEQVQLHAYSTLASTDGDISRVEVMQRWTTLVKGIADRTNPLFGHLSDDYTDIGDTGLAAAIRRNIEFSDAREVLRGYSWVTICPQELVDRIGGISRLIDSGAFFGVEELRSGGAWLQATENIVDYDDVAVRRVFEALAPVLPSGRPRPILPFEGPQPHLVWEDAADFR